MLGHDAQIIQIQNIFDQNLTFWVFVNDQILKTSYEQQIMKIEKSSICRNY